MDIFVQKSPDVVWWSTEQTAVDVMLEMADIKRGDILYDLGCGDGRIVITAAKRYGIKAIGFDVRKERVIDSRERVKEAGVESLVTIEYRDMFKVDLSGANIITMYLLPQLNLQLIPQLNQCRPGTKVLSYDFDLGKIKPEEMRYVNHHTLYRWTIPFNKKMDSATEVAIKKRNMIRTYHDNILHKIMF